MLHARFLGLNFFFLFFSKTSLLRCGFLFCPDIERGFVHLAGNMGRGSGLVDFVSLTARCGMDLDGMGKGDRRFGQRLNLMSHLVWEYLFQIWAIWYYGWYGGILTATFRGDVFGP